MSISHVEVLVKTRGQSGRSLCRCSVQSLIDQLKEIIREPRESLVRKEALRFQDSLEHDSFVEPSKGN